MLLEKYPLPKEYMRNNKFCFLDPIRNILIPKTPEEIVRQQMVVYLQEELGVPQDMIMLEEPMTYFQKGARGRADIIVYRQEDDGLYPVILVECKSTNVELTDDVFEQAVRYDQIIMADVIVLTNGTLMEWYAWNEEESKYYPLAKIPTYKKLIEKTSLSFDKRHPFVWVRPSFESLFDEHTYREFLNRVWIGEGTEPALKGFIMNLSGCLQDTGGIIKPGIYQGIKVIFDGGIRYTRFGNAAGGNWPGEYRYVIIEDANKNNQIISFAIMGQMITYNDPVFGNSKGHSILIVAIDDYDKKHNSLQLNLDRFVTKDGENEYTIWHDGKLTSGNKGSIKKSLVIEYIKRHAPELIDPNGRVILGRFKHSKNIQFIDKDMMEFFGKLLKYAFLRDEFRKNLTEA